MKKVFTLLLGLLAVLFVACGEKQSNTEVYSCQTYVTNILKKILLR